MGNGVPSGYFDLGRESVSGTGLGTDVPPRPVGLGISGFNGWPKAVRLAKRVAVPSTVASVVPRRSLR